MTTETCARISLGRLLAVSRQDQTKTLRETHDDSREREILRSKREHEHRRERPDAVDTGMRCACLRGMTVQCDMALADQVGETAAPFLTPRKLMHKYQGCARDLLSRDRDDTLQLPRRWPRRFP